jgi:hypothetical protein
LEEPVVKAIDPTVGSTGNLVPQQRTECEPNKMNTTSKLRRVRPTEHSVSMLEPASGSSGPPVTVRRETAPAPAVLARWDQLVDRSPGTDVTQLAAWATIRALVGYTPTYLLAFRGEVLVGGALVLRRTLLGLVSIGYLPYGPVIDQDSPARDAAAAALVDALTTLAGELTMTFVQPPEGAHDISNALLARGFRASSAGIAPAGSYRMDLTPPLEEIRAGFSKRLKSWTNRWESKGVTVRHGDERDLPLLHELMAYTAARQNFTPPSLEYMTALYHELAVDGHAALFVGEVHGKPVSADVVTMLGGRAAGMVRGRLGGFDGSGDTGKLSVPASVRWEIIKWAKQQGYRWLDFGGLPERMVDDMIDRGIRTSEDWPSAQRGKLAFNGTPFRYPTPVELIRPSVIRYGYDLALRRPVGKRAAAFVKNLLRGNRRGSAPTTHATANSADLESLAGGGTDLSSS